ncbi:MAG: amidase [Candidatus Rokubacteria bacterium]|nr:amidase [Candidatus Rokubacteria bacterium]
MTGDDLAFQPATALAGMIRDKQVSPVDLVQAYLSRIDRLDDGLRAYVTVCRDAALAAARAAESRRGRGAPLGRLGGVPFAVKDQFDTKGVTTTQGSKLYADRVPDETATVVARLEAEGAILLGKLNMTEFALGGTQDFPFGQPRNPWHRAHDPGGSSSGSGIATAAALAAFTLGEDTGGSVRSPAGFCGVVGIRPTWGRVSRHGVFPLSWSMDAPGPLGRTVADVAMVLAIMAGRDPRDPLTSDAPVADYPAAVGSEVGGLRIGMITELTAGPDTSSEVRGAIDTAAKLLGGLGARVDPVSIPTLPLAGAVFMALADSEGAGLHMDALRTRPLDFDRGTRRRLIAAGLLPTAITQEAARARVIIRTEVLRAFDRFDVLLSPTAPSTAASITAMRAPIESGEEAARRFFTRRSFTTPASLAGLPAISVPCGFSVAGLPIGLHLMGRVFDESTLFRVAHAYERATPWHQRRPAE